ncbi:MAG: ThuA domain-containing protein [Balneolaceae bacterium]|nr:ThuA domain-containing protein [Balneolaceae bacterium]
MLFTLPAIPQSINKPVDVLILGGGSSHDFERLFNLEDPKNLAETGAMVRYTDQAENVELVLPEIDVLYLSNYQPLPNVNQFRKSLFDIVESGKSLLLVHVPTWYNWSDWPEYNRQLVEGRSKSHEPYGEFEAEVVDTEHPLMQSVPKPFSIIDELYHFQPDNSAKEMRVLAKGFVSESGEEFPIAWTLSMGTAIFSH